MDPTNLLLIEGDEKSHYTWIKNYDRLLSYGTDRKVFCPYCCYGFRKNRNGKENLRKHKLNCAAYGELKSWKITGSISKKSQKCKRFPSAYTPILKH